MKIICIKPIIRCNFNCPTCQERLSLYRNLKSDKKMLDLDSWKHILDEALSMDFDALTISGGEPLLYPHLLDIVAHSQRGFTRVSINTNASLLSPSLSDKLVMSGLTNICISLTDFTNKNYMISRGITNNLIFKQVLNNIVYFNKIKGNSIHSNNKIFLTKLNLFDLNSMILRSKTLGFNSISLDLLEGNFFDDTYRLTKEDIDRFIKHNLPKIDYQYRNSINELVLLAENKIYKDRRTINNCDVPGNFCIVLSNGDVHPCNIHEYSHETSINLFDYGKSLRNVFNSDSMKSFIKKKSLFCDRCQIGLGISINL